MFSGSGLARALALAAILCLPFALAQSAPAPGVPTKTILYFHVFDTFNKFPINTQPMDVSFFDVGGTNFPTVASQGYDFNTIYGYSTSGPVEYDFIENGRPRFHPERGIADNVLLDKNTPPMAFLYIDVKDVTANNTAPMALPSFTVRIAVREGNDLSDESKLDQGALIMSGQVSAHVADTTACAEGTCAGPLNAALKGQTAPDGLPVLVPDDAGVVEFAIPLAVAKDVIPQADAYNVRIDWWQNPGGAAGDDEFSSGYLRLVADQAHLPRLELSVLNPIGVDFLHPQVAAGTLLVHSGIRSPWGTYDVDVDNVAITVEGPSAPKELDKVVAQHAHVHNMHDSAAEVTWLWRFRDEGAQSGDYKITLRATNLQGTAVAESTALFRIEDKKAFGITEAGEVLQPLEEEVGSKEAPAALVLLPLGAAAVLARRRRSS